MPNNLITEQDLPISLTVDQAVEAAYSAELAEVASKLARSLPVLIEADKDVSPYLFINIRNRLKAQNIRCIYLDGNPNRNPGGSSSTSGNSQQTGTAEAPAVEPPRSGKTAQPTTVMSQGGPGTHGGGSVQTAIGPMAQVGMIGTMISQLRDAVRGAVEQRVVVLPHLDLLTTSEGGLTGEAREVIPLLYENPELVWLGFKDPTFPLPKVIENLFAHRVSILGTSRGKLPRLITQKESRKFGKSFTPWQMYKYVSGVNAAKLRRLLSKLEGEDYPADPKSAYRQLRQATLVGSLEIPDVNLETEVGGYESVKRRLRLEIIDVLARRDATTNAEDVARLEELIPRGMILWGPPGTGKTFFAKAIATAIGAALTVVSGPELKSKWVGESEENLRQIFHKARQSAPAIIVFDELDSFATARGTYRGTGIEHSMVNQLLTEMDGFHKEELVFVVGTTNFVESLDPALLRPGRFEFNLHIPYPDDDDRRAIVDIYNRKMKLKMTQEALDYAVRRTGGSYITATGTRFTGDHIQAMCRAVARIRLRENRGDETTAKDIERGLTEYDERKKLKQQDEIRVATHEAGHFVCAMACVHHPVPERITINGEMPWAPFYVEFKNDEDAIGHTRNELLDFMCVGCGGIEAERLMLDDIGSGASGFGHPGSDLARVTQIAQAIVERCGMGEQTGLRIFRDQKGEREVLSGATAERIDKEINSLISQAQAKAAKILSEHRDELIRLRDEVIEKKVLERDRVQQVIAAFHARYPDYARPAAEPAKNK
jgi:cell division protease FtsH